MLAYDPPLADYAFLLHQVLAVETRRDLPGYGDLSPDFTAAVLGEAGRLVVNELLPLNLSGDAEGCTFADGAVRTPRGFKEAYGKLVDGGWIGLSGSAEYGGQGLPGILSAAVSEFLVSANMGFSGYVDLTQAAARTLWVHGTADQKARYLGPLTTGAWGGAMALTEPQAGTDLGLLRCRAEAAGDGTYRITGSKLFITAADHDLTDNIVVLTLARLPGGPPGTRGLSLFLVPRFPVAADGTLGPRNAMTTVSLEHKMGVRASATCALAFEGAVGELIGGEHEGLARMFTMMNDTRLGVGMQGLAIAEVAYQNALAYARDRRQGRAPGDHAPAAGGADPIVRHPDVRRMLLRIKSFTGAARALALWTAVQIDTADGHPDPAARREAEDLVALMTPVIKAHFTDMGSAAANLALQCYGGHGYIREWGVEQLVRDVRITQIYEGTNGVQALDLVGRKLRQDNERAPRLFLARVADTCAAAGAGPARELVTDLAAMADTLGRATDWIVAQDRVRAAAAATDYLGLFARVALAWSWVRIVMAAGTAAAAGTLDAARAGDRARTAAHYLALARPEAEMLAARCRRCVDLPDLADFRVDGDAA
ncbi:MAG: acyl-CoA dehydrogenase [Hyphomicrobiales bacterium]|nr:acyl-CoA dehydrogenase [Hyphomicrobiales bacterium]MCP5370283.1 acyl-CoA dehydrogenase [Hyphomicrobiales bacterium]